MLFSLAASAAGESVIRFRNQDQLTGSLESLSPEMLTWSSPILEKPTPFFIGNIADLTLPAKVPVFTAQHEATLKLTNGDVIRGQLAAVSKEAVELDTWFAGRLSFRRAMVKDLELRELPKIFYQGPIALDGWQQSGDGEPWKYEGNSFISQSSAGIGRDMQLPDTCSISFQVEWRSSLRLKVVLFAKEVDTTDADTGYELVFQRRTVRFNKSGDHDGLGYTNAASELQKNEKATIEMRSNLKTGQFAFYVDGRLIDVWTDVSVQRNDLGRYLQFVSEEASPVRISAIRVAAWDGAVDQAPAMVNGRQWEDEENDENKPEEATPKDRIQLWNGDYVAGEMISIEKDLIVLKTTYGEVKLPISRLRSMPMGTADLETPIRRKGDVRAWFYDGSSVVFRLDAMADGTLQATSQNFGSARFKLEAFTRLEFNIYGRTADSSWMPIESN